MNADAITIRAARPADAEGIAELLNQPRVRWGTLRQPFTSPEQVGQWMAARTAADLSLVAATGGAIVGEAGFNRFQGRRAHAAAIGLAVHDAHQGRGIGAALLAALIDAAERWHGIRRLELTVFTDNAPAIALYGRFGFVHEGTLRALALRDGVFVDGHAMARVSGA